MSKQNRSQNPSTANQPVLTAACTDAQETGGIGNAFRSPCFLHKNSAAVSADLWLIQADGRTILK